MKGLETCSVFVKENEQNIVKEHNRKEKEVFRFFEEATREIGSVFARTDEDKEVTDIRVQFVIVFTFIDILASYFFEYQGKTGTQKSRFIEWIQTYCFKEENEYYKETFHQIEAWQLYTLRSSMVHFFGLGPKGEAGGRFMLIPNDEDLRKVAYSFVKNQNNKGVVLYPLESKAVHDLVTEGAILMLGEWSEIIEKAQTDTSKKSSHIAGIDRIYQKIMCEGAVKVEYKGSNQ